MYTILQVIQFKPPRIVDINIQHVNIFTNRQYSFRQRYSLISAIHRDTMPLIANLQCNSPDFFHFSLAQCASVSRYMVNL